MRAKKYLAQLTAVIMGITTVFAMPLYAAEQKPVLQVEEAVKAAIGRSNEMAMKNNAYEALKEQMTLQNNYSYYQYQTIYLKKAQNEQQKGMVEDKIANDITTKYGDIIALQKEIEMIKKKIDIGVKELMQMDIKNKKGFVNPIEFKSKQVEVDTLKMNLSAKEEQLKNDQAYLQVLTGKDITKYSLDENIKYEPFRITGSIDGFINSKIEMYLQYDKELAKLDEDNLIQNNGAPIFYADYLSKKSSAEIQMLSIEEKQQILKQNLITSYASLISLEDQINSTEAQFDLLDKKLKSAQLRYNAGIINVVEYNKQVAAKQEAVVNKLKLMNQYNALKTTIQKPWAAIS